MHYVAFTLRDFGLYETEVDNGETQSPKADLELWQPKRKEIKLMTYLCSHVGLRLTDVVIIC